MRPFNDKRWAVSFCKIAVTLDRRHWLLLALAAPFLLFPSPERSWVLLVVPAIWLVAWLARSEPLPRTPLNGTLLLLSVMILVSTYATYDVAISLPKISGMVLAIGVFFATVREGRRPGGWWLSFIVFLAMGLGIAGLGLLGTRWIAKVGFLTSVVSRLPSYLTGLAGAEKGLHPNEVAGALLWVIPAFITFFVLLLTQAKALRARLGRSRAMMLVSVVAAVIFFVTGVFVLTQSRGGYIALALTVLTLILVVLPPRARRLVLGSLMILAVILGVVLSRQGAGTVWERLIGSDLADDPTFSLNTVQARQEIWSRALYGIQDFPFTGMGMNTFRHVAHVLYPLFVLSPNLDFAHAHNEFLQAALDLGIPGLVAFLALYVGAFGMLRESWQTAQRPGFYALRRGFPLAPLDSARLTQTLVLGLGGGLLAHMFYGLMDAVALGAKPGVLFWMLLGLIVALHRLAVAPTVEGGSPLQVHGEKAGRTRADAGAGD